MSDLVKVRRDGTLTLFDGTGPAVELAVVYTDGDFSADGLAAYEDRTFIRNRGSIVGLRKGDDPIGSISFNVHMRQFTDSTAGEPLDFVRGTKAGVVLVSTGGAGFEQFVCGVKISIAGDASAAVASWTKVIWSVDFSEGDPDTLAFKGECMDQVTLTGL
jgi:hypothetical protein